MPGIRQARTGTAQTILIHEMPGNRQINFRTFAYATANRDRTPEALGPLVHSCYSVVTWTPQIQGLLAYAATIILHSNPQLLLTVAQHPMKLPAIGVLK